MICILQIEKLEAPILEVMFLISHSYVSGSVNSASARPRGHSKGVAPFSDTLYLIRELDPDTNN